MQVKRYRAKDMKQAMDAAIRELGSDAVMLTQTKVRDKGIFRLFRKPLLEVTFAYDPTTTPKALSSRKGSLIKKSGENVAGDNEPLREHGHKDPQGASNTGYNEKLEQRMDSFEAMLSEFMKKFDIVKRDITYDYPDDVQALLKKMTDTGVREELAHSLAKQTEQILRNKPGAVASEALEHLLHEQFGRAEPILHKKFTQKVILVLGPTGVGKTTSMVKLAADFAVKQRKKVGIINTDTYRIGAQEQLQTYADILGVPIQSVYYSDELSGAMEQMSDRDMIFVDTAGKRIGDEKHKEDLLELVRILQPEDILLCLASTTSFASIMEMVDTYGFIDDYRVMITKLDETKYRGSLLNISWYTHKPIAYVTTGQNVPDDIEIASIEKIVKQIVDG
ncbi:MAG: flagellar biosynthesis protein FlhF [Oscillospiraceae bacterium]|nr:flagellar biosynthesis protein FlhF [Oscillospiraceae bacterium]